MRPQRKRQREPWALLAEGLGYDVRQRPPPAATTEDSDHAAAVVGALWREWGGTARDWDRGWVPGLREAGLPTARDAYHTGGQDSVSTSSSPLVGRLVRCRAVVRWADAPEVLRLYETLARAIGQASHAADPTWARKRVNAFHAFAESLWPRGASLLRALCEAPRERVHAALAGITRRGYVLEAVHAVNLFTHGGLLSGAWLLAWQAWPPFRTTDVCPTTVGGRRRRERPRDVFTAEELRAMEAVCRKHPVDDALFVTFTHTNRVAHAHSPAHGAAQRRRGPPAGRRRRRGWPSRPGWPGRARRADDRDAHRGPGVGEERPAPYDCAGCPTP